LFSVGFCDTTVKEVSSSAGRIVSLFLINVNGVKASVSITNEM
jgi:hypothetical protein